MFYLLSIILCLTVSASAENSNYFIDESTKEPCSAFNTVNITGGFRYPNGSIFHHGVYYAPEHVQYYSHIYKDEYTIQSVPKHLRGCVCFYKPCVRSCCWYGEHLIDGKCELSTQQTYEPLSIDIHLKNGTKTTHDLYRNPNLTVIYGKPCENGFEFPENDYRYNWGFYEKDIEFLTKTGSFDFTIKDSCVYQRSNESARPYVCWDDYFRNGPTGFPIGMIIAAILLFIICAVYLFYAELRETLHGKCIIYYAFTLMAEYILMIVLQYFDLFEWNIYGYSTLLLILSTHFWIWVLNYDVWIQLKTDGKISELVFITYVLVAFGIPLVMFLIFLLLDFVINDASMFLMIFVIITANAVAVALILNIVFIVLAARYIRTLRRNRRYEGRQTDIQAQKERLDLYFIMFIISFIVLIIKYICYIYHPSQTSFIIANIVIAIHALILFGLLVFAPKMQGLFGRN